jgi:hypothetical protein
MEEAHATFEWLKCYLTSPPMLVAPNLGLPMLLYITAKVEVVSMVLIVERQESHACPDRSPAAKGEASGFEVEIALGICPQTWPESRPSQGTLSTQILVPLGPSSWGCVGGGGGSTSHLGPLLNGDWELTSKLVIGSCMIQRSIYLFSKVLHEAKTRYLVVQTLQTSSLSGHYLLPHLMMLYPMSRGIWSLSSLGPSRPCTSTTQAAPRVAVLELSSYLRMENKFGMRFGHLQSH